MSQDSQLESDAAFEVPISIEFAAAKEEIKDIHDLMTSDVVRFADIIDLSAINAAIDKYNELLNGGDGGNGGDGSNGGDGDNGGDGGDGGDGGAVGTDTDEDSGEEGGATSLTTFATIAIASVYTLAF